MKVIIDPEFHALIPPLQPEERKQLEDNIKSDGCRDPLVVWNGILLDGHNRYEICSRLKLPVVFTEVKLPDRISAMDWIDSNQLGRRNLKPDVATILRGRMYNRAKKSHGSEPGGRGNQHLVKAQVEPLPSTAERIAKDSGVSPATVKRDAKKAEFYEELSKNAPEKAAAVFSGAKRLVEIVREKKEEQRESRREENRSKVSKAPEPAKIDAKFATIIIDPPWDWGDEGDVDQMGRAKPDYSTMSLDQLMALPLSTLSDVDCHIYMWITNRSLPKGFHLLERWGFRYVTALTWPKPSFGMGNYFRGQTEHVLFGVKGSQMLKRKNASTLLPTWQRGPKGHSSKPSEFYEFIESCSPGPYLEMFSRLESPRKDWTTWGENK